MYQKKIVTVENILMGKVKYKFLKKTFTYIASGVKIPKHNYTFRVDGEKIYSFINAIQNNSID